MLRKNITYTNVDGHQVNDLFYFNLTKAELLKLNMKEGEGFQDYLKNIVASQDANALIETFDKIVGLAYGERTQDGKFVKSVQAYEAFKASEAYSVFFMELVTSAEKSAEFIRGIMPADLANEVAQAEKEIGISKNLQEHLDLKDGPTQDPEAMTEDELLAALGAEPVFRTAGFTDADISLMTGKELAKQPREVLERAFWLKQNQ